MAISFPRADFPAIAPFARSSTPFRLESRQEISRTAGGVTLAKDLGPALWRFDLATGLVERRAAMEVVAWFQSLDGLGKTFLLGDPTRPAPAADTGASLAAVAIHTVSDGALRLKGLPAGFALTPGDLLSFTYGASSSRALHEVAEGAVADGSGVTPLFEVRPRVRVGAAADISVALRGAAGLFRLADWATQPVSALHLSFTFSGEQVI